MPKDVRTRNWLFVFYPDSAPSDWADVIESWCVNCFVSPLHDLDVTKDGELKKPHYHAVLQFDGVKSYGQVLALVKDLGCSTCKPCNSLAGSVRYLAHLDSPDKAQYSVSDIKTFGHCDLSALYDKTSSERAADIADLVLLCQERGITEFSSLCNVVVSEMYDSVWPTLVQNHVFMRDYLNSQRYVNLCSVAKH